MFIERQETATRGGPAERSHNTQVDAPRIAVSPPGVHAAGSPGQRTDGRVGTSGAICAVAIDEDTHARRGRA